MTLSSQEAATLLATAPPVSREAAEKVLNYLVWNKAMIGESLSTDDLLERYMTLVKDLREGVHVVIQDPFQKATALLFELVLSEEFNPWEIDLVKFTQLYMDRVKDTGMDFTVAGRLIYMAWNILLLQSQEILTTRHSEAMEGDGTGELSPIDDTYLGEMTTPEAVDVTHSVLTGSEPPLEAMVRHAETRPVSLMELARAFQEAEEQAKRSLEIQEARNRLREAQRAIGEVLVHGDIPESELAHAWETVAAHPVGEEFDFSEILGGSASREKVVALFIATLFLVREGVVTLHQDTPGVGPIRVRRTSEERPGRIPAPEAA